MLLNSKLVLKLFKPSPSNHLCSCSPCGPLSPHPLPFTLPRCQLTKRARPLRAALVGWLRPQPPPPGLKVAFDRRAVTSFGAPAQLQSPVEVSQRPAPSTRALTYSIKAQWISATRPAPLFFFQNILMPLLQVSEEHFSLLVCSVATLASNSQFRPLPPKHRGRPHLRRKLHSFR